MPILDSLLSVIAPHVCLVCGAEGDLLCQWCAIDAFEPLPARCYKCKRLTNQSATCVNCRKKAPIKHVWIRTQYQQTPKDLLHAFKFERAVAAGPIIARAMAETLPYLPASTVVVPVPTATTRVRQRGYDHAVVLANFVATNSHLRLENALIRLSQTRQVGADRKQRLTQLENAFYVASPKSVTKTDILLIDDVVTTGATIEAAAKTLKNAGAKSVSVLAFAQKQ